MRILSLVALIAITVVAACSDKEAGDAKAGATEAPAALPPGRPAIYAAQRVGPEAFVRALYAVYSSPTAMAEAAPLPGRDPIYSRLMTGLIANDFAKANGEVPFLNYDPVCGCQDGENFTLDAVAVTQADADTAEAAVTFTNMGETRRQTLKLVREGGYWKIEDVLAPGEKPLTEQMFKAIE